jgi:recombination protein RecA
MSKPEFQVVEGGGMDKERALEAALAQIDKNFGKGSIMRLGENNHAHDIEAIPTGSLGLDLALGIGGLPRGRVIEIYGPESSGKTTLALHVWPKPRSSAAFVHLWMPSMRSTRFMPASSVWTSMIC